MDVTQDEFVDCPPGGRRVVRSRRVRLGDVTVSGRVRFDALARYLQDIAADDVADAGIVGAWVVRRMALRIGELPRYGDELELTTFCSGTGSRWAERRTTLSVAGRTALDAVAIWVYVDDAGRPALLQDWFWDLYRVAADGRSVSGRLRHGRPPDGAPARRWPLRRADFDVLGHANNAVAWAAVEDAVADAAPHRRLRAAAIEYRTPIDPDDDLALCTIATADRVECWLTARESVRASAVVDLA